jgi:hypothetical protein
MSRRGRLIAGVLAAAAWSAAVATSGLAQSEVIVEPTEIALSGVPGSTLTGVFTLTSPTDRVVVAPSVTAPASGDPIPVTSITVTPDRVALLPALPQAFRVTVVAPSKAGEYVASIVLTVVPDPEASDSSASSFTRTVEIALTTEAASASPEISIVGSLKATRVACTQDCWFAERLLPAAERKPTVPLIVQNTGTVETTVSQKSVLAVGERTGTTLTKLPLASPEPIPSGELRSIEFQVGSDIEPDRYVGQSAIAVEGSTKPVVVPIDLTIRRGPAVPMVLLTLGLAAGVLLRTFRSRWIPLGDASARFESLVMRLAATPLSSDERGRMNARMEAALGKLREGRTTDGTSLMDAIDTTLQVFDLLLGVLTALLGRTDPNAVQARGLIAEARPLLFGSNGQKPDIAAATQKYEDAYVIASADPNAEFMPSAASEGDITFGAALEPPREERAGGRAVLQDLWLRSLRGLRWVVRGLLVGLALIAGMLALYVAPTAGFIGNAPADVAALLFWGFGSGWVDKVFIDWS